MIYTLVVAIITCITLILSILLFPKIRIKNIEIGTYWVVCLIGAILMVVFKQITFPHIIESLMVDSKVNPIKILILFFSMTLLSIFLDEVGFFKYLATKASKLAKSNQKVLFLVLYSLVSLLTIFTSNDIVILTFTPFICYFCKNAKIDPIPYLVGEFAGANTWSMMLIIGNPTNIYLATVSNINFIEYFKVMAIPTITSGIIEIIIIYILFRKRLSKQMNLDIEEVKINDRFDLIVGLVHLGLCMVFLIVSSYIKLDMWLISLMFAISLIMWITISTIIRKKKLISLINTIKRLPWELIPFVISMFIIVSSLNNNGISNLISNFLGDKRVVFNYGLTSFLVCNLINNIPMSVLYSTIPHMSNSLLTTEAIYSTIIGSNIGAFLTPIGALAGIMFTNLLTKYNVKYGFKSFVKYGVIIAIPTIVTALISLLIEMK